MTCSDAGQIGALKRRQLEREPILEKARAMREADGLPPSPALTPPLVLTTADQITNPRSRRPDRDHRSHCR